MADRDEDFNTRYASYRGWQKAIERVKPISRDAARIDLTAWVLEQKLTTPAQVVTKLSKRFLTLELNGNKIFSVLAPGAD